MMPTDDNIVFGPMPEPFASILFKGLMTGFTALSAAILWKTSSPESVAMRAFFIDSAASLLFRWVMRCSVHNRGNHRRLPQ